MAASTPEGVGGKDEDVKKSVEFLYVAAVYILMILSTHPTFPMAILLSSNKIIICTPSRLENSVVWRCVQHELKCT